MKYEKLFANNERDKRKLKKEVMEKNKLIEIGVKLGMRLNQINFKSNEGNEDLDLDFDEDLNLNLNLDKENNQYSYGNYNK